MKQKPRPPMLRSYRKRYGLTQDELGFLLGFAGGPDISRYELGRRPPTGTLIVGSQALFCADACEIFPDFFAEVESRVLEHAVYLRDYLERRPDQTAEQARTITFLRKTVTDLDSSAKTES